MGAADAADETEGDLHMIDAIEDGIEQFEPGLSARLMEGYQEPEIAGRMSSWYCRKCGCDVRLRDEHLSWHRNLTLAMNYQTYKATLTFGLLDTIMTNVAESGVTLDELVAAAYKAREN